MYQISKKQQQQQQPIRGIPEDNTSSWHLYKGQEITAETGDGNTNWLQVGKKVKQSSVLSS